MKRIAIFASGAGSNAQKIIENATEGKYQVALIMCNKPGAGVLAIAEKENIPSLIIDREKFYRGNGYTDELNSLGIDLIVLAGFLWKVPDTLINAFPRRIINIHPALLPKYGGKGMYGQYVHQAVIDNNEAESGITIHYVDEVYDHGDIIFQARCKVDKNTTSESLAACIHTLEHQYYPKVVAEVVGKL